MTYDEAVEILDNMLAQAKMDREGHWLASRALNFLKVYPYRYAPPWVGQAVPAETDRDEEAVWINPSFWGKVE